MRIWHQSSTEIESLGGYKRALVRHAAEVLGGAATVDVHGIPPGRYHGRTPSGSLGNAYVHHRVLEPILDNAVRAEREGYDAFVLGSYSEPFLRELRSAVDMPVASLTEASLLVGCSLGRYSAPVSNAHSTAWMVRMSVQAHGLAERVLPVRCIDPVLDERELELGFENPQPVIDSFLRCARQAIAEGADVIVPAEGMLAEILYANKVTRIGEAPVMDVFGVTWAYAEMLANLRARTGLRVGREWHYRRNDPDLVQELAGNN
jgi:Asp/Glu/hydantoin racemase